MPEDEVPVFIFVTFVISRDFSAEKKRSQFKINISVLTRDADMFVNFYRPKMYNDR